MRNCCTSLSRWIPTFTQEAVDRAYTKFSLHRTALSHRCVVRADPRERFRKCTSSIALASATETVASLEFAFMLCQQVALRSHLHVFIQSRLCAVRLRGSPGGSSCQRDGCSKSLFTGRSMMAALYRLPFYVDTSKKGY